MSFLVGMKQYAGNWASTQAFVDKEKEDRINERIVKAADNQIDQIIPIFGKELEVFIQKAIVFRMMHPMGRMHITRTCGTATTWTRGFFEKEFLGNAAGWNFGDAHCNDERLIEAVQEGNHEPIDLRVVFTESQPISQRRSTQSDRCCARCR